jgi:hypothetical protein
MFATTNQGLQTSDYLRTTTFYASESVIPIEGFGTVLVTVTTLEEPKQYTVYLHNVVLILLFHTSVASL